ncbi:MAG: hypothetical protein ACLUOI_35360 [Eisenbergiella sp.]
MKPDLGLLRNRSIWITSFPEGDGALWKKMEELARASLGITGMLHKMNAYPDEIGRKRQGAACQGYFRKPQDTGAG